MLQTENLRPGVSASSQAVTSAGDLGLARNAEKRFPRGGPPRKGTFHVAGSSASYTTGHRVLFCCFLFNWYLLRSLKMASIQRLAISVLLIFTVAFVFFAQAAEATKGPKITHKVRAVPRCPECRDPSNSHMDYRFISTSSMAMRTLVAL